MNGFLQRLNLAGILALAVLCILQWRSNRQANLAAIAFEKSAQTQSAQLAEKDKVIQGTTADLEDFRLRLTVNDSSLSDARNKLKAVDLEEARIAGERDQLRAKADALQTALNQWVAAVDSRDEALKKAEDQLQEAGAARNDAIAKFNELAVRYNTAQAQLKQAADQLAKLSADRNDAVARFNALADKYNAMARGPARPLPSRKRKAKKSDY